MGDVWLLTLISFKIKSKFWYIIISHCMQYENNNFPVFYKLSNYGKL